eukprot:NODE_371_length_1422_cov_186.018937_g275_i0.p1 GENE.NODE_371_length_1422_cov_186.018937_g275_i0~~NODE_371_length_1422_cov_186.018937_g275_i0.p1  ORF type:complete len:75 (+),score=12.30 NODE_371_length_1422_cov_186.018937_g275_i0:1194-1418(+)
MQILDLGPENFTPDPYAICPNQPDGSQTPNMTFFHLNFGPFFGLAYISNKFGDFLGLGWGPAPKKKKKKKKTLR